MASPPTEQPGLTLNQGRALIFLAAVLWSTSGFFSKILTNPTWFNVDEPKVHPLQMAFFRLVFAGLFLLPLVRRSHVTIKAPMLGMSLCFAAMNFMFLSAMVYGKAANAILLQYTAPLWTYLVCIWLFKERATGRGTVSLVLGLAGIAVLVAGGWEGGQESVILLGLGSGVMFAAILLFLRVLRGVAAAWLTVWNHLTAAVILAPFGLINWDTLEMQLPTLPQLGVLVVFGAFQMGFPYFLMARGLRVVSPQEASAITLLEPLLNPLWAFLVVPDKETPTIYTLYGGVLILSGLAWRYWPRREAPR
jgi:drug/metabolite transporter (DMT)-like permease